MQFNDQHFAIKLKLSLIITGFVDFTLKEMLNDMNVVVVIILFVLLHFWNRAKKGQEKMKLWCRLRDFYFRSWIDESHSTSHKVQSLFNALPFY